MTGGMVLEFSNAHSHSLAFTAISAYTKCFNAVCFLTRSNDQSQGELVSLIQLSPLIASNIMKRPPCVRRPHKDLRASLAMRLQLCMLAAAVVAAAAAAASRLPEHVAD